jgi:hypothetical protein
MLALLALPSLQSCRYVGPFSRDPAPVNGVDPAKISEGERNVEMLGGPYPRDAQPWESGREPR